MARLRVFGGQTTEWKNDGRGSGVERKASWTGSRGRGAGVQRVSQQEGSASAWRLWAWKGANTNNAMASSKDRCRPRWGHDR